PIFITEGDPLDALIARAHGSGPSQDQGTATGEAPNRPYWCVTKRKRSCSRSVLVNGGALCSFSPRLNVRAWNSR
ncbi:hypothetical protein DUNSADRAFT_5924, partial [Dunaliella salina]